MSIVDSQLLALSDRKNKNTIPVYGSSNLFSGTFLLLYEYGCDLFVAWQWKQNASDTDH